MPRIRPSKRRSQQILILNVVDASWRGIFNNKFVILKSRDKGDSISSGQHLDAVPRSQRLQDEIFTYGFKRRNEILVGCSKKKLTIYLSDFDFVGVDGAEKIVEDGRIYIWDANLVGWRFHHIRMKHRWKHGVCITYRKF